MENTKVQAVSWNITRLCNLKCMHCYLPAGFVDTDEHPHGYHRDAELSQKDCFRVIDEIAEINPHILLILTGGEPLLRPDILEISKYASDTGFLVVMGTNGVLLNDEVVEKMQQNGVTGAGLSIDSIQPSEHDKFRGMPGAWKATLNGVEALKRAKLDFLVQTSVTQWNYDEIPEIVEFAYQIGAKVLNLYFLVRTGRGKTVMDISPAQYENMLDTMFKLQRDYTGKMLIAAKCAPHYKRVIYEQESDSAFLQGYPSGTCPCGIYYCRISPEGELTPCPYLPVSVGNLKDESFVKLWNESETFQELRNRNLLEGKCGACEFKEVCGGCRARAYATSGNYLAADESCEYQPGQQEKPVIGFDKRTAFASEPDYDLAWNADAEKRLKRVPSFARGMVIKSVEKYAREHGYREITPELMKAVKKRFDKTGIPSFRPKR
ncbi:radical SAM protein [Candidatus Poribacteria bacterium]|nr:radical SAM protein [Candidatus Poribacteria bacterium]